MESHVRRFQESAGTDQSRIHPSGPDANGPTQQQRNADRQVGLEFPSLGRYLGERRQLLFGKQRLRELRQSGDHALETSHAYSASEDSYLALLTERPGPY